MKSLKSRKQTQETETETPQRRVVTPGTGLSGVRRGVTQSNGNQKKYSDSEKYVIDKQFHGDVKEYEKYAGLKGTTAVEKYTAGEGAGMAEKELARLTADNS